MSYIIMEFRLEPRRVSSGFMLFLILVHENETNLISKCIVYIIIFLLTSLQQTMPLAKDSTFLDKLFF